MIRNIFIILTLSLLVCTVLSLDCSDGGYCEDGETCCYDKGQSGCCGYKNAVCCDDGVHCCPSGRTCDLEKGKCVTKGYTAFLTSEFVAPKKIRQNRKSFQLMAKQIGLKITPEQQSDLFNGFLDGSELRKYVPDLSDCAANTTSVVNAFRQALADFSKVNVTFDDIADGIQMIGIAIEGLSNSTRSCKNLPTAFSTIIGYAQKIVSDPAKWFSLISAQATRNSLYIAMDLYALQSLIDSGKYKDVGQKLGEVFKYIFQVDLGLQINALFKADEATTFSSTGNIFQCVTTVYNVVQKAIPVVNDLSSHPENLVGDIMILVGFFKEIDSACAGVFNTTVIESALNKMVQSNYLVATPNGKKFAAPSIADIIACISSVKPLATDLYNTIIAFQAKDFNKAWPALEQAGIDAVTLGYTCYKVIKDYI